ncbi:MAG: hypothetical protein DLM61_01260 [Pseudonocardiales bacterium]|nr:MAG: hypothetical protein DLM61_01260 [Pseudonocardiales bacterium]
MKALLDGPGLGLREAQTTALGGKPQDQPNPKFAAVVQQAMPGLKAPGDVVKLAAELERWPPTLTWWT